MEKISMRPPFKQVNQCFMLMLSPNAFAFTIASQQLNIVSPIVISVQTNQKQGKISPELFGLNDRFAFNAIGTYNPATKDRDPELAQKLQEHGISILRYPGGTIANFFNWKFAVDRPNPNNPSQNMPRGCQIHSLTGAKMDSNYGPDEHMRFVQKFGGKASMLVNFATATPQDAADWVSYMNGAVGSSPWADLRARNGHPVPYGIKWWEVGNELDLAIEAYWMGSPPILDILPVPYNANAAKYDFGGSTNFVAQAVGAECARTDEDTKSSGQANQVKFAYYPPVKNGQILTVGLVPWREVTSLNAARANDPVYTLNHTTGELRFGDGVHGAIPALSQKMTLTYESGPHAGYVDFYKAMKAVDPNIQVCSSFETEAFHKVMGSANRYDCQVSHPYAPLIIPNDMRDTYHVSMGKSQNQTEVVRKLKESARLYSGKDIPIILTEWGVLPFTKEMSALSPWKDPTQHGHFLLTLTDALYVASSLTDWVNLGIPYSAKHSLVDFEPSAASPELSSLGPVEEAVFGPKQTSSGKPSYLPSATAVVMKLFTPLAANDLVATTVSHNPTLNKLSLGLAYDALKVTAGVDAHGVVRVIVINRDQDNVLSARIQLPKFGAANIRTSVVNGSSIESYNTPEYPNAVVTTYSNVTKTLAGVLKNTFPAHSVTMIEIR